MITLTLAGAYRSAGAAGEQPRANLNARLRLADAGGGVLQSWSSERGLLSGSFKTDKLLQQVQRSWAALRAAGASRAGPLVFGIAPIHTASQVWRRATARG